jgi:hypothetical protein
MGESRKRVIGIMAAILAARKLAQLDSTRPSPAFELGNSGRDHFRPAHHAED